MQLLCAARVCINGGMHNATRKAALCDLYQFCLLYVGFILRFLKRVGTSRKRCMNRLLITSARLR